MRRAALIVAFIAVGLAGLAVGRGFVPEPASPAAPTAQSPRLVPYAVGGQWSGPSLEQIRAVVREELGTRARPDKEPVAPTPPSDPNNKARLHLDAAIANGAWRVDDRATLLRLMPELSDEERNQVLSQLARAINDGSLRVEPGAML